MPYSNDPSSAAGSALLCGKEKGNEPNSLLLVITFRLVYFMLLLLLLRKVYHTTTTMRRRKEKKKKTGTSPDLFLKLNQNYEQKGSFSLLVAHQRNTQCRQHDSRKLRELYARAKAMRRSAAPVQKVDSTSNHSLLLDSFFFPLLLLHFDYILKIVVVVYINTGAG